MMLFCLLMPSKSFCQKPSDNEFERAMTQWTYSYNGNPIDGHNRMALRIAKDQSEEETLFIFSIVNRAESIRIKNSSISEGDNRDDVYVEIRSASFIGLEDVFIYFDNEKTYYKVNYMTFGENGLFWYNAIEKNDAGFLSRFNFIEKLKVKNEVFFRFKYSDGTEKNVSFSLKGSSSVINKVVDLSLIKNEDWHMDALIGSFAIADFVNSDKIKDFIYWKEISIEQFTSGLMKIQFELLGEYSGTYIRDYRFNNEMIEFYNLNDEMVEKVHYKKILNAIE